MLTHAGRNFHWSSSQAGPHVVPNCGMWGPSWDQVRVVFPKIDPKFNPCCRHVGSKSLRKCPRLCPWIVFHSTRSAPKPLRFGTFGAGGFFDAFSACVCGSLQHCLVEKQRNQKVCLVQQNIWGKAGSGFRRFSEEGWTEMIRRLLFEVVLSRQFRSSQVLDITRSWFWKRFAEVLWSMAGTLLKAVEGHGGWMFFWNLHGWGCWCEGFCFRSLLQSTLFLAASIMQRFLRL